MNYTLLQDKPGRRIIQLHNGLIVIVQQRPAVPVVSVQAWIKTGSIYEQEFVGAGLSHYLEHLLSGGSTSTRSEDQTNRILGSIGARTNAATGLDQVHYYINTTSENASQAVDLLTDWMRNNLITQTEFDRERQVIVNEFSMGEGDPARILWKLTQQARYRSHPARHPTIGYLDEFLKITRDQINDFYHRMYVPNNMVFVVAGDVDCHAMTDHIASLWADAKPGPLPSLSFPIEPPLDGPKEVSGFADVHRPRLRLAWPSTRVDDPDDVVLDVLAMILGSGESSRLNQTVRDESRSVFSVNAYNFSTHWGPGFFGIDAEPAVVTAAQAAGAADPTAVSKGIASAKAEILSQVDQLISQGITQEELAKAKRQVISGAVFSSQTVEDVASRLAHDVMTMGDPDYLSQYVKKVQAVTDSQVQSVAKRWLRSDQLITVTMLPRPQGTTRQALTRPAEDSSAANFPRQKIDLDNRHLSQKMTENSSKIDEKSASESALPPIQRHVLSNGLRILIQKDASLPGVAIQFSHLGGLLAESPGREGICNAMTAMMIKGIPGKTARQLALEIESLGARLSVETGNNSWLSQGLCLREDWEKLLTLQALVVQQPTFPHEEWQKLQPRLLAAIDRQTDSWGGELRVRFLETYFKDHPWSVSPIGKRQSIASLQIEDLHQFHQDHLGASDAVLAIVGDIDPQEVLAKVQQLYAHLPSEPKVKFSPVLPGERPSQTLELATNKAITAVQIGYGPGWTRTSPDYPAMEVLVRVLSSFPSGWLDEELRGRGPGLVYAVGATRLSGLVPGYFAVIFNTQPQQAAEALSRSVAMVDRLKTQQVGHDDIVRAKSTVLTDEFYSKQTLMDRAASLAINELYALGLNESEEFRQAIHNLTAEQLQKAAQTYLCDPVTVILSHQPTTQPATAPATTQSQVGSR